MLKKDNFILGLLIGVVMPAAFFGILSVIKLFVETGTAWTRPFETSRMIILALAINVIPIRLYFVNYKCEKTGRGVLLATFIFMMAYFLILRYF